MLTSSELNKQIKAQIALINWYKSKPGTTLETLLTIEGVLKDLIKKLEEETNKS